MMINVILVAGFLFCSLVSLCLSCVLFGVLVFDLRGRWGIE